MSDARTGKLCLLPFIVAWAWAVLFCLTAYGAPQNARLDPARVEQTVRELAALGCRITGTPGCDAAARMIERRFRAYGLKDVQVEEFEVTIPVNHGCSLQVGGEPPLTIYPLWPNLVRTCSVPREGVTAPLIDGGRGRLGHFNGKPVAGSLVLMDFNVGSDWFNAPLLGARAVLFIEPKTTLRGEVESKFLSLPADIPRFWVPRKAALRLRQRLAAGEKLVATLKADVRWEKRKGRNILGWVDGTDPELNQQYIVISAYYDSISAVPDLAPGAENACGIATLLEIARCFAANPPRRTTLFLATAGHFQCLAGVKHFFRPPPADMPEEPPRTMYPARRAEAFIGLDLSSHSRLVCLFNRGFFYNFNEDTQNWKFSDFGKLCTQLAEREKKRMGVRDEDLFADAINTLTGKTWRSYMVGRLALDAEEANLVGVPGVTFATGNDIREAVDTPFDTPERMDFDNLALQAQLVAGMLADLQCQNDIGGLEVADIPASNYCKITGELVEFDPKVDYFPNSPVAGALAVARGHPKTSVGVRGDIVQKVGTDGRFEFIGLPKRTWCWLNFWVEGYYLNPKTGVIEYAPDLGRTGDKTYKIHQVLDVNEKNMRVVLFRCAPAELYDVVDQRHFNVYTHASVLDAASDSEPFAYGAVLPERRQQWSSYYEPLAVVFGKPGERLKFALGTAIQKPYLLLNSTREQPLGRGFDLAQSPPIELPTPYQAARDMWLLDDFRIRRLQRYGIEQRRINELHADAKKHLDQAQVELDAQRYDSFFASVRAALSYEMRVYPDVVKTTNDVVKAVLFYLALLIPFAYFCERLFIAATSMGKQILGAAAFFVAIFLALWLVHPALGITRAPLIVLLAFIMMTLTALVVIIVVGKFDHRMRVLRQQISGVRDADVGRLSASGSAFTLGVSNMRRRKIRTALTCTTLILVTFTILSFTSVQPEVRLNRVPIEHKGDYIGALVRDRAWEPLGLASLRILQNELGRRFPLAARTWYLPALVGNVGYVEIRHGGRSVDCRALVGVMASEVNITNPARALIAGRWVSDDPEQPECILPRHLASLLGISLDEVGRAKVQILGAELLVVGIVDGKRLDKLVDIDGEPITPVDYEKMEQVVRRTGAPEETDVIWEYEHLPTDQVAFVSFDFARNSGAELRSIAINFGDTETARNELKYLTRRIELNIYAREATQSFLVSSVGASRVHGAHTVIIPLFIAALIVLNTMLGSVYERTGEIGIFSAVGLAPVHIASLFVAEALVYAVLGAVAGYLLGQVVAKLVVTFGIFPELSLNYSSVSAVGTVIVVMLTVLASVAYPAHQASRLATPGVDRRWRLVDPQGGVFEIELPFSATGDQVLGLEAFLYHYLEAHVEYSTGNFTAGNVRLFELPRDDGGPPQYGLAATIWIAPYDLGVREHFELRSVPSPDSENVHEFVAIIVREDGDEASWIRLTRNFLTILRQQFLLWRTFDPATQAEYREKGYELLAQHQAQAPAASD